MSIGARFSISEGSLMVSQMQPTLQCLRRKPSGNWPWLPHGFASCFFSSFPPCNFPKQACSLKLICLGNHCCVSTGQSLPPLIQLSNLHWNTAFSVKPLLIPRTDVKVFSLRYPLYLVLTSRVTISVCYGLHVFFLPKLNSLRTGLCCHFDHSKPSTGLGAYEILFEWINQVDIVNKNKMSFLGLSLFQS